MESDSISFVDARTHWQFLALPDEQLEQADVLRLNLAVACGIPGLESLDIEKYTRTVDAWTAAFTRELPRLERMFKATPHKWKNDLRFFRVGMLQGFLGHEIGIWYIEEQKQAEAVRYTDPGQLFLHGLIDTKQGTCGNMAALHVAMCRRMGWPVSLACVRSHFISRFDDGEVIHNIEATSTHPGAFASDPDEIYIEKFNLPKRAIECGSDLRKLTAREMIGVFLALRGRHYCDTQRMRLADLEFALSRVLFPNHRRTYVAAMAPMIERGSDLFDRDEVGHPNSLFDDLAPQFGYNPCNGFTPAKSALSDMQVENNNFRHRDMHVINVTMPSLTQTICNGKEKAR